MKPRIFVSSTYYDLKHIRNGLKNFIDSIGYESVLFEHGDIPYHFELPLYASCMQEVGKCDILVLIIGGHFGSPISTSNSSEIEKNHEAVESATIKEYQSARDNKIPIYIFIERNVHAEYKTFQANKGKNHEIEYAHADDKRIYNFIEQVYSQKIHPIHEFDKFEDISNILKDQWAGLFAEYLRDKQNQKDFVKITSKIEELSQITESLKTYTESLMKTVKPENYEKIINEESKKINSAIKKNNFFKQRLGIEIQEIANKWYPELSDDLIYSTFMETSCFEEFVSKLGLDQHLSEKIINNDKFYIEYAIAHNVLK